MRRLQFKLGSTQEDALEIVERELLGAFDRVLHAEHPNPKRIGCPGREALQKLVDSPDGYISEATLDHFGRCAPCVDDLRQLRQRRKGAK